jgi:nicotinamidase-related amidase
MRRTDFIKIITLLSIIIFNPNIYAQPITISTNKEITNFISRKHGNSFSIKTFKPSYYALNASGDLIPQEIRGGKYYAQIEGIFSFTRTINPNKTALIVMDPWEDSGSPELNKHFDKTYQKFLLPVVRKSVDLNMPILFLTNDKSKTLESYGSKIYPELELIAKNGKGLILNHQDLDKINFSEILIENGIDTLIYSGFASNMCVLGTRSTSLIKMHGKGIQLFFIPEASSAIEFKNTWETNEIHKIITLVIGQSFAELIEFKDYINISKEQ